MVDKNLFIYDLAIVSMMKYEAPYVKEWLDYHLLAGADHFFIYDHESPDNFKEVLQPYIDAGIVTYKVYPDEMRLVDAYTDAYKNNRFFCRYMAFIDADEFIFPQNNKSIAETVDEILKDFPNADSLGINWRFYGSNFQDTADYSKGVLERFTRRNAEISRSIKSVTNPRRINFMTTPHYVFYFDGFNMVDFRDFENKAQLAEKIIINHYYKKSREEYAIKVSRGDSCYNKIDWYKDIKFSHEENNDVFDDSILKYRDYRQSLGLNLPKIDNEKLVNALMQNLAPMLQEEVSLEFFEDKMENFLTCRALATYLKKNVIGEERGALVENLALQAIHSTMLTNVSVGDSEMLVSELPNILKLNYPVVENIRQGCIEMIPQIQSMIRANIDSADKMLFWKDFHEFGKLLEMLKVFDSYQHK